MLISFNWLRDYVPLDLPPAELTRRLMLAGLNHESTEPAGADFAIDLEVTSNRPDCLGHLGIAREAAVLLELPLKLPAAAPAETGPPVAQHAQLAVECPDLCPRYTARVIRGVTIKSSPAWLADRLQALGIACVNNVVDVTNYVLMECGQPLHAFDLGRLSGSKIVVRKARAGEVLQAIDHKEYKLPLGACLIADGQHPVTIAGIMGGASTEVGSGTRDILLESAEFDSLVTRTTARALGLHSPSSYRFERGVDPAGVEWASRRACQLILQLAGGELCSGLLAYGDPVGPRPAIVLRLPQLQRILGIEIPLERVRSILRALGLEEIAGDARQVEVIPPSWRRDLTREIDLVEEVARIHGYDAIPEDVRVPMAASIRTTEDRVLERAREVLVASGFDEAYTLSVVEEDLSAACSPWTSATPLATQTPVLGRATLLRRSLIPSLLAARRTNESLGNAECELFEIARGYLPQRGELPREELLLTYVTDRGLPDQEDALRRAKGVVEAVLGKVGQGGSLETRLTAEPLFDSGASCELWLGAERIGVLGMVSGRGLKQFELRKPCLATELRLGPLFEQARLVPKYRPLSPYPAIGRDINLVVEERVSWADLARSARSAAGPDLELLECKQVYRDEKRLGAGKKSVVLGLSWRSAAGTLTNKEADTFRDAVVEICKGCHGAELRT